MEKLEKKIKLVIYTSLVKYKKTLIHIHKWKERILFNKNIHEIKKTLRDMEKSPHVDTYYVRPLNPSTPLAQDENYCVVADTFHMGEPT